MNDSLCNVQDVWSTLLYKTKQQNHKKIKGFTEINIYTFENAEISLKYATNSEVLTVFATYHIHKRKMTKNKNTDDSSLAYQKAI